jgi:hypothetical protein
MSILPQSQAAFYPVTNTAQGLAQGIIDASKYHPENAAERVRP